MHEMSKTELKLLKVLWDAGQQTVRQIAVAMYAPGSGDIGAAEIGTVHSLLSRLEKKRLVRRSRRTHPHQFAAKVSREDVAGDEIEAMANELSEGSIAPLLMRLISKRKLTATEAGEIRNMLDDYKPNEG